jgi:hypothetical protein
MSRIARALLTLLLCSGLAACYVPSAMRRSARIVAEGWDTDERGAMVALTGPGSLLHATGDFALNAFVPIHYDGYFLVDRREPAETWFRRYGGTMMPMEEVAVLCHRERSTVVRALRGIGEARWREARHERWHYPRCIEVLPGSYQLVVFYLSRETVGGRRDMTTRHVESIEPSTLRWDAAAGGVYALSPVLGDASPASGPLPRSRLSRRSDLGTSWFELEVSEWHAQVERLPSPQALEEPVLEYREAWARYERLRR